MTAPGICKVRSQRPLILLQALQSSTPGLLGVSSSAPNGEVVYLVHSRWFFECTRLMKSSPFPLSTPLLCSYFIKKHMTEPNAHTVERMTSEKQGENDPHRLPNLRPSSKVSNLSWQNSNLRLFKSL